MTRADMSPKAVTIRLVRTSQLRRLCLDLRRRPNPGPKHPEQAGSTEKKSADQGPS